ncbi:MAG: ATP-dependent helicase [Deltaproteobacteria bacterium]|nr:ATP-dependent helicase [Deltaproteobacteria bacterium]
MPADANGVAKMDELTANQQKAIEDNSRLLTVTAGAGSGKTRVLIERVGRILAQKKASLSECLVITFTDKAASELRSRLLKTVEDDFAVISAHIGTFHSLCSRVLKEHAPIIGIDPDFKVVEPYAASIAIRKTIKETLLRLLKSGDENARLIIDELDFKNAANCLLDLMEYRWHADKLYSSEAKYADDKISTRENRLRNAVFECFCKIRDEYRLRNGENLDFQDLEIFTISLLQNAAIRTQYQKRFKYILVDEFQDINDTQAELINLLHDPKINSLAVVGDPKQSIYRFRGANVHQFEEFVKKTKNTVRLGENFRSGEPVIEFVNKTFPNFEAMSAGAKKDDAAVTALLIGSKEDEKIAERRKNEASAMAKIASELKGSTACLFYSLSDSEIYGKTLHEMGIPHVVLGGRGFLEKQEIVDILNAIRVSNDHGDIAALLGFARSPYIGISDEELFEISLLCRNDAGKVDNLKFYGKIAEHPKASIFPKIEAALEHMSISELIKFIAGGNINDNIEKLAHIAASAEERERITLSDFIDYLKELKAREGKIEEYPAFSNNALALMTIHQAKGLEFDNVIMADLSRPMNYTGGQWLFVRGQNGGLAFKFKPEDNPEAESAPTPFFEKLSEEDKNEEAAEHERLLYVGMTRAKKRLIMLLHPESGRCVRPRTVPKPKAVQPKIENLPLDIKNVFTVSELETFDQSKEEYFKKYVRMSPELRPPSDKLPPNVHGDIIHRLIEMEIKYGIADAAGILNCMKTELELAHISKEEEDEILRQFAEFKRSSYSKLPNRRSEVPFFMAVGGSFVKGTLDMLITDENAKEWEIVDFKTGQIESAESTAQKYKLQVDIYALAIANHTGIRKGSATLLFLTKDEAIPYKIVISENDMAKTETKLKTLISDIAKTKAKWITRN